ncbi:unnamed protein product [Arabis nemorensis]|uniref:Uncharacterized protein n=1 Tax=Arabis nemorensis TaxID=586526 RepID=A0A565BJZ4_9BRAS|nr:unnamed protein product [Arabis nemorensis]
MIVALIAIAYFIAIAFSVEALVEKPTKLYPVENIKKSLANKRKPKPTKLNCLMKLPFLGENNDLDIIPAFSEIVSDAVIFYDFESQISGKLPLDLGNLPNIQRMLLSSNYLSGEIPSTFAIAPLEKLTVL